MSYFMQLDAALSRSKEFCAMHRKDLDSEKVIFRRCHANLHQLRESEDATRPVHLQKEVVSLVLS